MLILSCADQGCMLGAQRRAVECLRGGQWHSDLYSRWQRAAGSDGLVRGLLSPQTTSMIRALPLLLC